MLLARHRVRFLELADIFLASGMVPAYTAAAFIKKFARLALTAPPAGEKEALVLLAARVNLTGWPLACACELPQLHELWGQRLSTALNHRRPNNR